LNERSAGSPAEVVAFWREAGPEKWFTKDAALDQTIKERFAGLHREAAAGTKDAWAETPEGALTLLLLLDQFSRNLFRGSAETYAQDAKARDIARQALARGFDQEVEPSLRPFFYLPFMHSELLADHQRCVALAHALGDEGTLKFAKHHQGILRRFGRFPHRNDLLGRHTTPAEREFLESGGFAG
jgi:uncharacterized protein (DUF924 family)